MEITEFTNCRACDGKLRDVFFIGDLAPSGFYNAPGPYQTAPLALTTCMKCNLVQLRHSVDRDFLYHEYWYKSALNKTMLKALEDVKRETLRRARLQNGKTPRVVDIGANDGSLLAMYPKHMQTIGFEPAKNLAEEAMQHCEVFIGDYFSAERYGDLPKADIITAIAMFYDLDDPRSFLKDIKEILAPEGIFVIQMTDLVSMLKANAVDNICHEHVCYYSLTVISRLLNQCGLAIFDIEYNAVNGGSVRLYISHQNFEGPLQGYDRVWSAISDENRYMSTFLDPWASFAQRVTWAGMKTLSHLLRQCGQDAYITGLGASTKGNTLLQFLGIDYHTVGCIGEVNEDKFGLFTVASNIPIISEEDMFSEVPDTIIVLPWHFRKFFEKKLEGFLEDGGELLFPLPVPQVVTKDGTRDL